MDDILRIESISQFNQLLGLGAPDHPLISLYGDNQDTHKEANDSLYGIRFTTDLYVIMYKDSVSGSLDYGRNSYDFQHGTLLFLSPGQVITSPSKEISLQSKGWTLLFHPDLIRKSSLGQQMDEYSYFSYEVNEALHLSPKEESFISEVVHKIEEEYSRNLDQHSHRLILSNLELLLNYCVRFYDRQFYTRTDFHKDFIAEFEQKLKGYFNTEKPRELGIPSVGYFGEAMNMSPNYLSDLLKKETGKSTRSHINEMLIERAKTALLNSEATISEIAYTLGFEYHQSFSRLFKSKMGMSPQEYRTIH
ncbi:MAG: helix-turn-helix transcriptional regulator [Bacteroidota bacterium]